MSDSVLPKFNAKVIVGIANKFKVGKLNTLSQQGIRPPRPRRPQHSPEKGFYEPADRIRYQDAPEFPPRYVDRLGATMDIRQLNMDAEVFKT